MIVVLMSHIIGSVHKNANIHGNAREPEYVPEVIMVKLMDGVMVTPFVHSLALWISSMQMVG